MMRKVYVDKDLSFKQLASGPAPVGRILNYIKLAGDGVLKHKNENRNLSLKGNIGYAWTTEFMFGLGIIKAVGEKNGIVDLALTDSAKEVYSRIKSAPDFDENAKPKKVRIAADKNCPDAVFYFEKLFKESIVYEILCAYLEEYGYEYKKGDFTDGYFRELQRLYDKSSGASRTKKGVRTTTATTGGNRVPSLIQLCVFFGYAEDLKGKVYFDPTCFGIKARKIKPSKEVKKRYKQIMKSAENLSKKYGINGNVLREVLSRSTEIQKIFRNNLFVECNSGCMVCGIKNEEMLVASHINPAAKSNAAEKADSDNGLLLCANHDKLFDRYLITFSCENGKIKIADRLNKDDRLLLGIDENICLKDSFLNAKRKKYLKLHNDEFEKLNNKS